MTNTNTTESQVTPWEVKGDINYDKLIKEFGVQPLDKSLLPKEFQNNILFRREIIFAHRSFEQILNAIEHKKPFVMMTGLMPTGKFHIGHMLVAKQMIFYQSLGAKTYICVADIEAYNARGQSLVDSRKNAIEEYILNYIALGLKPENCEIYFQSERSSDAKKANAYYQLQNLLARHITFNEFKAVYGDVTPGKMVSALLQASDMLHPQLKAYENAIPVIVPVGIDQDPHIRLARDVSSRIKIQNFKELSSTYHIFLPGLSGGKMSSSDATSYVALTDTIEDVARKVKKYAFSGGRDTLDEHRRLGGNPDIDVSYQWLRVFEENDTTLKKICDDYKSGALLSGELKNLLIEKLTNFLTKHQIAREHAKKELHKYIHIKDKEITDWEKEVEN
jgi:tryptophanyl-tRNA synthetase